MANRHKPGDEYPLWEFTRSDGSLTFTRGRTWEEAHNYYLSRGQHVIGNVSIDIRAARAYSTNHRFDWFHIPPYDVDKNAHERMRALEIAIALAEAPWNLPTP